MSAQDTPFSDKLSRLETFRSAVWGNNSIFRKESPRPPGSNPGSIKYLDFGEHHRAVQSFCHAAWDEKLLVVFEEYHAAINTFKSKHARYKNGACIIGQPGIGKSCFIAYAVIERLREKEPVAVQVCWSEQDSTYLLFTANAVTIHGSIDLNALEGHNPPLWAFSDSNADISIPMAAFTNTPRVRIFQTTCPAERRWKKWTQENKVVLYVMDVPSTEEVEDLAFILGKDMKLAKTLANKWGPVPRILLELLDARQCQWILKQNVVDAIYETTENPGYVFEAIANHNISIIPDLSLVFFTRPDTKTRRDHHSIYVPTRWLFTQVVNGLFREQKDARGAFFNVRMAHSATSWIFEVIVHDFLVSGENFAIKWSDQGFTALSLPILKTNTANTDLDYPPPFYWRLSSLNYPGTGIDGVIVTEDHLYVIQAMVALRHCSPQEGLTKLWENVSPARRALRWKFVFVGWCDDQAKSVSKSYAEKLWTPRGHLPVGWFTVPLVGFGPAYMDSDSETDSQAGAGTGIVGHGSILRGRA